MKLRFLIVLLIAANLSARPILIPQNQVATVNLGITITAHKASLSWSASTSTGLNGYNVYRSTTSGSGYAPVGATGSATLTYTDSTVISGKTYFYVVTAYAGPVTVIIATGTSTTFTWTAVTGATGYSIQREVTGTNNWTVVGNVASPGTSYTDTTTVSGTSYSYQACPSTTPATPCGESPFSNQATAVVPTP